MPTVIVSLEGVNLASGFIVREMSLYFVYDRSYRHYFFKKPLGFEMSEEDRRTDRYYRNILGGIGLTQLIPGALDYRCVAEILLSLHGYFIYTCGNVSSQFLRRNLPYARITDIQDVSTFTYSSSLQGGDCGIEHPARYCSLSKIRAVTDFCQKQFN